MAESVFDKLSEKIALISEQYAQTHQSYLFAHEGVRQTRLFFLMLCAATAGLFLLMCVLVFEELLIAGTPLVVTDVVALAAVILLVLVDIVHDHIVRRPRQMAYIRYSLEFYSHQQRALASYTRGDIDEAGIRMMYEEVPIQTGGSSWISTLVDWCIYTLVFFGIGLFILLLFV